MKLYEKLKLLREEKGITQDKLIKDTGLSAQAIRNYENPELDRLPNTVQLKMLKDYFGVTYEYLLDENCQNKTVESVNIGKKLNLSDKSIQQIISLQNHKTFSGDNLIDKESPITFDRWLSSFDSLSLFVSYITDYYVLNDLLQCTQYFSGLLELAPYIVNCLNINKKDLEFLFELLDSNILTYKKCVTHGDTSSKLDNNSYNELNSYLSKLKKYCSSYKPTSNKNSLTKKKLELDDELFNILNEITEIGAESYLFTHDDLQFCEYKITECIRDYLHYISVRNEKIAIPSEYQKHIKQLRKDGKIKWVYEK